MPPNSLSAEPRCEHVCDTRDVGRTRDTRMTQLMVAVTHHGVLVQHLHIACFIARRVLAGLWSHNRAICTHTAALSNR